VALVRPTVVTVLPEEQRPALRLSLPTSSTSFFLIYKKILRTAPRWSAGFTCAAQVRGTSIQVQ
jgi:hypothetical protein